jgi:hypothetical protein
MDLADLLASISQRGFAEPLDLRKFRLKAHGGSYSEKDFSIVDTVFLDSGTDPGDDVTVYLIRTASGACGYLIVPDSPHVETEKAQFIDAILEAHRQ